MKKQMLSKVVIAAQFSVVAASSYSIRGAKPCGSRSGCSTHIQYEKLDNRKRHTGPLRDVHGYISAIIDEENSTDELTSTNNPAIWRTLLSEDFNRGLGVFKRGSEDVLHLEQSGDRRGVVRLQGGEGMSPLLTSNKIGLDQLVSKFRVIFSFHGLGIEDADSFCLDHSLDDGVSWNEEKCWNSCEDFRNNIWYNDEIVEFTAREADTLRIRFRCSGGVARDDVLIDKIEIQAT